MGSDLYRVRVIEEGETPPSVRLFDAYLDDLEHLSSLVVPSSTGEATFAAKARAVSEALRGRGPLEAIELLVNEIGYDSTLAATLERDATQLSSSQLARFSGWVFMHRLLEEAFPAELPPVRGTKLRIEVLQLGFDQFPVPPDEYSTEVLAVPIDEPLAYERIDSFCLRILCEATSVGVEPETRAPLIRHFEQYAPGGWMSENFGADGAICDVFGILWSAELVELRENAYESDGWWSTDPYANAIRAEQGQAAADCSVLAVYEVVIHPHWLPRLTNEVFGSRAF